jgi:hypothetical protein
MSTAPYWDGYSLIGQKNAMVKRNRPGGKSRAFEPLCIAERADRNRNPFS